MPVCGLYVNFLHIAVGQKAGHIKIMNGYKDYKEILADPEIGAVLVCSSTDTHAAISIEAIEAGKHVFCEKPVDLIWFSFPTGVFVLLFTSDASEDSLQSGLFRDISSGFDGVLQRIGHRRILFRPC